MADDDKPESLRDRITAWAKAWGSVMAAIAATAAAMPALKALAKWLPDSPLWLPGVAPWFALVGLATFLIWVQRKRLHAEARVAELGPLVDVEQWPPSKAATVVVDPTGGAALISAIEGVKEIADVSCRLDVYNRSPYELEVVAADLTWNFLANNRDCPLTYKERDRWQPMKPGAVTVLYLSEKVPFDGGPAFADSRGDARLGHVRVRGSITLKGPWKKDGVILVEAFSAEDHARPRTWIAIQDERPPKKQDADAS